MSRHDGPGARHPSWGMDVARIERTLRETDHDPAETIVRLARHAVLEPPDGTEDR